MKHLRTITQTAPAPAYISPGQILTFLTSFFTFMAIIIPILLPLKGNGGE
jgi:hypothetical protein